MHSYLTSLDIKILEALCEHGPRNLSKVAKAAGISRSALEFRLKRMRSNPKIFLAIHTSVYHTNIGLKKAVIFMTAKSGMEQILFEALKCNGFWMYVCRTFGFREGCVAVYAVPAEHCKKLEEFIYELEKLGVASDIEIYWTTCFQGGRISSTWFDNNKERWTFNWDDWVKEVQSQSTELPYTLTEPESYEVLADDIDVKILMWLEYDGTKSIKEIAEKLGISRQRAMYHYKNHVLKRNLIEGYEIFVMRYGDEQSLMAYFILSFHNHEQLAKFAKACLNKFFILTMGKVLEENMLVIQVFLPFNEFRKFIDTLSLMAREKILKDYKYAIQDLRSVCRQTFSGEFFENGSWKYDHESHLKTLHETISKKIQPIKLTSA